MKITEKQRQIVKIINDQKYTIDHIEHWYKEQPKGKVNYSFELKMINEVNAYMAAIEGICNVLNRKDPEITA